MGVAGWRGGTTDLCPGQQKPSRRHWTHSVLFMNGAATSFDLLNGSDWIYKPNILNCIIDNASNVSSEDYYTDVKRNDVTRRVNDRQSRFQQFFTQIANVLLMSGAQFTTFIAPQNLHIVPTLIATSVNRFMKCKINKNWVTCRPVSCWIVIKFSSYILKITWDWQSLIVAAKV